LKGQFVFSTDEAHKIVREAEAATAATLAQQTPGPASTTKATPGGTSRARLSTSRIR